VVVDMVLGVWLVEGGGGVWWRCVCVDG
jgi:hypothetical protein